MLDTDTKRRIDTARDILVGKVPDPKSQVEQITIALIYKFMDDMDAESEELGGKRKFFTGEFARYGWAKLMDRSLGGHEMLGHPAPAPAAMKRAAGDPSRQRRLDLARRAFKEFYAQCFWSADPDHFVVEADLPWIIRNLRQNGGHRGYRIVAELCR